MPDARSPQMTDAEADAVSAAYARLKEGLTEFPIEELREIEPALRSMPAPIKQ
jgi:hypothetical protein